MAATPKIENLITLITLINSIKNNVSIILGANNSEPHIINFAEAKLSGSTTIICISDAIKDRKDKYRDQNEIIINNNHIFFIKYDFNSIDLWLILKNLEKVNEIIVDWSTTKFLYENFILIKQFGEIIKIIFDLLIPGGRFYSEYMYDSLVQYKDKAYPIMAYGGDISKLSPELFALLPKYSEYKTLKNPREQDDSLIEYIEGYKSELLFNTPANYNINFITYPDDKKSHPYPLFNDSRVKSPHKYFYFEKLK